MDSGGGGGGGYGVELRNVSKFSNGVDRVRNADNEDKSSLFCARIFELNFGILLLLWLPAACLLTVLVFAFASTAAVTVSLAILSVTVGSISNSVFNSRDDVATASVVVNAAFCSDGNTIFKFGRSNLLCLYAGGCSVDNDESVAAAAVDGIDVDVNGAVVVIVIAGIYIIFFGTKLLKRFIPGDADANGGVVVASCFAFKSILKCDG